MTTTTHTVRVRMDDDVIGMLDAVVDHYAARHPGAKVTRSSVIRLLIHQTYQLRQRDLEQGTPA